MSTQTGPDLTSGREAVERLMDDTIRFSTTTDADAWEMNPSTLRLEPPAASVVYDGPCKVKPLGNGEQRQSTDEGEILGLDNYRIDVPISAPFLPEGTTGVITSSRRFPYAVGEVYAVKRITTKTLAVQASYTVERRTRVGHPLTVPSPLPGGSAPVEDPNDPGTFIGVSEDPSDPGTFA